MAIGFGVSVLVVMVDCVSKEKSTVASWQQSDLANTAQEQAVAAVSNNPIRDTLLPQ
jgi:hypothetical protein